MLMSLAYLLLVGLGAGLLAEKLHLPALLGMLLAGIVLGPYGLSILSDELLSLSTDLRQLALVIILLRAGLSLNVNDLKKVGKPAILMCFVPACFEIVAMMLIAPRLFHITLTEAALLGSVIGAVSPAVIVPKMIRLMENGYGTAKSIPQLILAGASVDDVFVIVLFSIFTSLALEGTIAWVSFIDIPISIVLGIVVGVGAGWFVKCLFRWVKIDAYQVLLLLSVALLLNGLEQALKGTVAFSGLLAVMCMGITIKQIQGEASKKLSLMFSKLWSGGEILLFVLVGAAVNIHYAVKAGWLAVLLILCVLVFRMVGVACCLIGSELTIKERIFCMIAYLPKATVQAAIGSIPLSMGLACGELVLTIAVLSILIAAPLGAFLIDLTTSKLLIKAE